MASITITITDLPNGAGALVLTDGQPPTVGQALTPAQALAMDLLRTSKAQAREVRYGPDQVPLVDFARSLLDPERLGHAALGEIATGARRALNLNAGAERR
ncbi:MAG TPA: hypothetical protein VEA40_00490 [Ramlibacter sp.]|nr:hypothetical protein [Ramlibacter sp.]